MKSSRMAGGFCVLILCCAVSGAANLPENSKLVPAETLVYLGIPSFDALQGQWEKTSYYKLYKDPAMAKFVESFKGRWQKELFKDNDEISELFKDVNSLPSGKVVAALVANQKTKTTGEPMLLFVAQWGAGIDKVRTAVDKKVKKAVEEGAKRTTEKFRNAEIITIETKPEPQGGTEIKSRSTTISKAAEVESEGFIGSSQAPGRLEDGAADDEEDDNEPAPTIEPERHEPTVINYCYVGDAFLLCEDKEILKSTIAKMDGAASASLGDSPDFTSTMAALGPAHDIDLYVNVTRVFETMAAADKSGSGAAQMAMFGLDNVTGLGLAVGVARNPSMPMTAKALLKINGAKKGVLKMLEPQTDAVKIPRFIDSSAVTMTAINISLKSLYDEIFKMAGKISPGAAAAMNTPIVPPGEDGQGGVELKKDLLDYLGSQIVVAQSLKKPFATDTDPKGTVTSIAVSDAKALEKSIARVHSQFTEGKKDMKRQFKGHTLYSFGVFPGFLPGLGGMSQMADGLSKKEAPSAKFALSITDTSVILGLESDVEKALLALDDKQAQPATSQPWFSRAKTPIPAKVGAASFSDDRSSVEYFWWVLKQRSDEKKGGPGLGPGAILYSQLEGIADFTLLPEFAAVKKYFGVSSWYLVSRPEGFYFESFVLDQK